MNRADLQQLSQIRVADARVLLDNGQHAGAYYILGYAVECALKACIARRIRRHDFPDRKLANDSYTHDLESLLNTAGLRQQLLIDLRTNRELAVNWAIVKEWSEQARYDTAISEVNAWAFYIAVTARGEGVLSWLRKWW